jgi:hypothetical protein
MKYVTISNNSVIPLPRCDTYHHWPLDVEGKYAKPHRKQTVQESYTEHSFTASLLRKVTRTPGVCGAYVLRQRRKYQFMDILLYASEKYILSFYEEEEEEKLVYIMLLIGSKN